MINGVVGFGESVVDFIPVGTDDGCTTYKACPGGSVANLCVVVSRLGVPSAFIGGVGKDSFGYFLRERIADYGVDTSSMIFTEECGTNLTFVHLKTGGQREYSFVNLPGAEKMVSLEQIDLEKIFHYRVLHVSSNAMACGKTREAEPALLKIAKEHGMVISYDVNYRPNFYHNEEEALEVLKTPLKWADIVKVKEEELEFLTGGRTSEHAKYLLDGGAKLVLITKGDEGSDYILPECEGHVPACRVNVTDTTGAGDCFLGGFLSWMLTNADLEAFRPEDVHDAVVYGNKAAALSIQKTGAMSSVPSKYDIEKFADEK